MYFARRINPMRSCCWLWLLLPILSITLPTNLTAATSQGIVSTSSKSSSILRARPRKLSSSVACSRTSLVTTVSFPRPFYGNIFAKGYGPDECNVVGNGSRIINFRTKASKCGIQVIDDEDTYEFQVYLYIQYEQSANYQNFDERIFVRCAPQEILLSGTMGRRSEATALNKDSHPKSLNEDDNSRISIKTMESHEFAESTIEQQVESQMDIMRGRLPFLKPIDSFVDIGEDVTVLVKVKNIEGIDTKISRCYAHDGTHLMQHNLTDEDGCTIDAVIMPNFKEFHSEASKVLHTTFPAFKFPDRANLHIQCTLLICNTTCPKFECNEPGLSSHQRSGSAGHAHDSGATRSHHAHREQHQPHQAHRLHKRSPANFAASSKIKKLMREVGLTSSVGVRDADPLLDDEAHAYNGYEAHELDGDQLDLNCFTSPWVLVVLVVLFCSLLAALTFAICMAVRVRALTRRLALYEGQVAAKKAFYPYHARNYVHGLGYGRMADFGFSK